MSDFFMVEGIIIPKAGNVKIQVPRLSSNGSDWKFLKDVTKVKINLQNTDFTQSVERESAIMNFEKPIACKIEQEENEKILKCG